MPVICGSSTLSVATAVTAASAAVPPARSASIAASVASGCEVAAMPSPATTAERPGRWKSRIIADARADPGRSGRVANVLGALERDVALGGLDRDGEAAHHVDEADDEEEEERAGRGLL